MFANPLAVDAQKLAELKDRWSDISPEEGTEECVCSMCGRMIGAHEDDPRWRTHDRDCVGCAVCEIAVRMWNEATKDVLELRFHNHCFGELLKESCHG